MQPLWPGSSRAGGGSLLRGWGCGPSASSRGLRWLCVCPQPPAGGKGGSPQHPRREQLSLSGSHRGRAMPRFHKCPCWCYTPLGLARFLSEAVGDIQRMLCSTCIREFLLAFSLKHLHLGFFTPVPLASEPGKQHSTVEGTGLAGLHACRRQSRRKM